MQLAALIDSDGSGQTLSMRQTERSIQVFHVRSAEKTTKPTTGVIMPAVGLWSIELIANSQLPINGCCSLDDVAGRQHGCPERRDVRQVDLADAVAASRFHPR